MYKRQQIILDHGVAAIQQRTSELVAYLVAKLRDAGYQLTISGDPQQHAGIVMIQSAEHAKLVAALAEQGIIVDHRPGHVRVSPFFYTLETELDLFVERLQALSQ